MHVGDVRTISPPRGAFTHVVHCASAAPPRVSREQPDEVVELIVRGTERMLDAAEQAGAARFLLVNSGSVYGPQPPDLPRIDEHHAGAPDPADPAQRFAVAKRRAEALAFARGVGLGVVSARVFGLVGPRLPLDGQFAIGQFLGDALAMRPIRITGDGTPVRSWMYAADLAAWCWTLLARGIPGHAYNVGSEESASIWRVAREVAMLRSPPLEVTRAADPDPGASPSRYVPSIARARAELGLDAWTSRTEALARTWTWLTTG